MKLINKLICKLKGHKFIMHYNLRNNTFQIQPFDKCECCNERRDKHEKLQLKFIKK